ncbi:rhotekin-like isoform X2 [Paramacrobiotus metropolitanus]|nr:rhotekin-like isoform X2 [Paramacrobiotus metropolitanus]
MQSTQKVMVDSSMADVVFNEFLEFSNITPSTTLYMEVFSYACSSGANKNYSPVRKLSRKLSRSLTRAFGRRCLTNPALRRSPHSSSIHADLHAAEYKQQHQLPISSLPNFTKIADCQLPIDELVSCEEGRSHILTSRMQQKGMDRKSAAAFNIPLFGSFACRSAVQPYCATKEIQIGKVNIRELDTGLKLNRKSTTNAQYFCTLINAYLYCYNADRDRRLMEMAIRIDKETSFKKLDDSVSLQLANQSGSYVLTLATSDERNYVLHLLQGHVQEIAQWSEAALVVRDLKLKPNAAKNELRRRGSLYDEIPISMSQTASCVQMSLHI